MVNLSRYRYHLEQMYTDRFDITQMVGYERPNRSTGHREQITAQAIPCRLSYGTAPAAGYTEANAPVARNVELFTAPDVDIPAGSKISVYHCGRVFQFQRSGLPRVYETHQEIDLVAFEAYA